MVVCRWSTAAETLPVSESGQSLYHLLRCQIQEGISNTLHFKLAIPTRTKDLEFRNREDDSNS